MHLSNLGEFHIIRRFLDKFPSPPDDLKLPPGDDCAVIKTGEHTSILITTDLLVEDVHFRMQFISPYQLGRKSMAVNLSDIAAMGGIPRHAFLSIGFRKDTEEQVLEGIASGIRDMCLTYGVFLSGGDVTASPDKLVINLCVTGEAPDGKYLTRSGARPGDLVQISGPLGGSAAGLHLVLKNQLLASFPTLEKAHLNPEPRLSVGKTLNQLPSVHSMIDISDGLVQDLSHICTQSGTGAEIYTENIPLFEEAVAVAKHNMNTVYDWALTGGEDYELCWTVNPESADHVIDAARSAGAPMPATIGRIVEGNRVVVLKDNCIYRPVSGGWDHFRP